uniref:Chemokine interleukin-8-like domain-containing protein n=1 Tax=Stegastes partitus TaxID=144197 RepID=A0A3B5BD85_9TELE
VKWKCLVFVLQVRCKSVVLFLLGPMRFCCIQYQETKVLVKVLKSYRIQDNTGYCNIKAVVFRMKRNKDFCGNPDDEWVQKAKDRYRMYLSRDAIFKAKESSGRPLHRS